MICSRWCSILRLQRSAATSSPSRFPQKQSIKKQRRGRRTAPGSTSVHVSLISVARLPGAPAQLYRPSRMSGGTGHACPPCAVCCTLRTACRRPDPGAGRQAHCRAGTAGSQPPAALRPPRLHDLPSIVSAICNWPAFCHTCIAKTHNNYLSIGTLYTGYARELARPLACLFRLSRTNFSNNVRAIRPAGRLRSPGVKANEAKGG